MSGSVNKVILVGNLGRDPEIRSTKDGSKVATLSLATSETWKDKNTGDRRERTEWHRVVVFGDGLITNVVEPYLSKGSKIFVEGQLQTRKWTDQSGQDRYTTEVTIKPMRGELTMLSGRDGSAGGGNGYRGSDDNHSAGTNGGAAGAFGSGAGGDLDDEIPF